MPVAFIVMRSVSENAAPFMRLVFSLILSFLLKVYLLITWFLLF